MPRTTVPPSNGRGHAPNGHDPCQTRRVSSFIYNVTFDCTDPASLAGFWAAVTGYEVGETRDEKGDQRDARDREHRRDEAELDEPPARVRDHPREQKVQRRTAAFAENCADELADGAAAREERERLVLVRRPDCQPCEEKRRGDCRKPGDADAPQRVGRHGECERARALGRRRSGVAHFAIIRKRPGTLVA